MSETRVRSVFLDRPEIEVFEVGGRPLSAYVKLIDDEAVRDVQPNPDVPVYFYLNTAGLPVGVRFYAPVDGYVAAELLDAVLADEARASASASVHGGPRNHGFAAEDLMRFLSAARSVKERLELAES